MYTHGDQLETKQVMVLPLKFEVLSPTKEDLKSCKGQPPSTPQTTRTTVHPQVDQTTVATRTPSDDLKTACPNRATNRFHSETWHFWNNPEATFLCENEHTLP